MELNLVKDKMYVVTTVSGFKFCSKYQGYNKYLDFYFFAKGQLPKQKLAEAVLFEDYNKELVSVKPNLKICVRCGGSGQYGKHGNCYLCGGTGTRELLK